MSTRPKKTRKLELLNEYFDAPLRAINRYYDNMVEIIDEILPDIKNKFDADNANIKNKFDIEKMEKFVVNYLRFLTDSTTFLHMYHAASGLSEELMEQTSEIAKTSLAHEMIYFMSKLKQPGDIQISRLKEILHKLKAEPIAMRVIRAAVLQRLYMFETSIENKQQISEIELLHIDMRVQRKIERKTSHHRILNSE